MNRILCVLLSTVIMTGTGIMHAAANISHEQEMYAAHEAAAEKVANIYQEIIAKVLQSPQHKRACKQRGVHATATVSVRSELALNKETLIVTLRLNENDYSFTQTGFLSLHIPLNPTNGTVQGIGRFHHLQVYPSSKNKGYARHLMELGITVFNALDVERATLSACPLDKTTSLEKLIGFYTTMGGHINPQDAYSPLQRNMYFDFTGNPALQSRL